MNRFVILSAALVLAAELSGCGNLARDVIVEKTRPDGAVSVVGPDDGGVWPVTQEDAAAPTGVKPPSMNCQRDGGCAVTRRCPANECSQFCTLGCADNRRQRKRMMSWHEGAP
jgi:hypothetical protein